MIRLLLIRHAKSSWDDPRLRDFDRPLSKRGRRGADLVGGWLRDGGLMPDHALVSPAARTRETWARIEAAAGDAPESFVPELYEAAPGALLAALRRAPAGAARLALVGHQPGIGLLARDLLAGPPDDPDFARYPTGATALLELPAARWAELRPGTGTLAAFVTPKRLAAVV